MLRTHREGADRAPTPANDVAALQNEQEIQESFERGQTSMRTTERLLQSHGGFGWVGGQDLRCVNQHPWGSEAGIYQSLSGLLSVLFRTTQLFQELLFKLLLLNF